MTTSAVTLMAFPGLILSLHPANERRRYKAGPKPRIIPAFPFVCNIMAEPHPGNNFLIVCICKQIILIGVNVFLKQFE